MTGSKVCTNCGDEEVEEDNSIAAEHDIVGPVSVCRRTNPSGRGTEADLQREARRIKV